MDRWSLLGSGPLVLADPIHIGKDAESYDEPTVQTWAVYTRIGACIRIRKLLRIRVVSYTRIRRFA
jgi:hypothetical protein